MKYNVVQIVTSLSGAKVEPSCSTVAHPPERTVHLGVSTGAHSVDSKAKPAWKGWLFSEFLWVSLQVRCSLSHFRPTSRACCCCTKYNPSQKFSEWKPVIYTPTGRPALRRPLKDVSLILIVTLAGAYRWEWARPEFQRVDSNFTQAT